MNQTKRLLILVAMGAFAFTGESAIAQQQQSSQMEFNLFQNFHTQPGASMSSAAMYSAPHPVPASVGYSNYTYQPLYPHQHLYAHKKNYYNYYGTADQFYSDNCQGGQGGGALNKTTVVWQSGANHLNRFPMGTWGMQKMAYDWYSKKYCLNCEQNANGGVRGALRRSVNRTGLFGRR